MAAPRDHKGPSLKKRLDSLEAELKCLQDKIVQKRLKKLQTSPRNLLGPVDLKIPFDQNKTKTLAKHQAKAPNEEGNDFYACLKSITRSIAQGSDAIRKIASLTDITSLNETLSSLLPHLTDQESAVVNSSLVGIPDKDLMAYHVNTKAMKSNSDYSAFEKSSVKGVTLSRSDGGISNFLSSSSVPHKVQYKSLQDCKRNLLRENQILRQKMALTGGLQAEVDDLRKKLKEETRKRHVAEKKITDVFSKTLNEPPEASSNKLKMINYEKRGEMGALDDDVPAAPAQDALLSVRKITSDEMPAESKRSMIEKKYIEEREKRLELEGIVAQFKEDLNAKKKECVQISVGQKLALAMAEQFKAKYEKESSKIESSDDEYLAKALKETKKECLRLQEELSKVQKSRDSDSEGNFKERALRAEFEVKNLHKRLDQFKNRNPLEATVVKSVLDKHKEAYNELVLAKKCSEAEYKARCRSLEGEVARLHSYYEKRVKILNNKIKELMVQLQEKMICIDHIGTNLDSVGDVAQMKKTMSDMNMMARQREAVIGSLNTMILDKEKHVKLLQKEKEEAIENLKNVQMKMSELQEELDKKGEEISMLLSELGEKSDEIAIKERILTDQSDTITSLRKNINDSKSETRSKDELKKDIQHLKEENYRLLTSVNEMAKTIAEAERFKEGQEKNLNLLHELEKQVYDRQKEWEHQVSTMSKEKDQAIQTANFYEISGMNKNLMMNDPKFSRLDQHDPWKKTEPAPVKKEKSIRLSVDLTDTSLRGQYIFSYEDLLKKAKSKEAKESKNGATALPDLMSLDTDEELKKIALNYEQKYGRETEKRRYRTYTDLGAGYDSEDSFIDNTEANEEGIPEEMDTKKGGFYINTGKLEFSKR